MDRIWQWAWERYGARYSWAVRFSSSPFYYRLIFFGRLPLLAQTSRAIYVAAAAITVGVLAVVSYLRAERFGAELRIGIGINTGVVIAGTIGGGGKLEFTLIGDTVNVAARVEQLTKTTGDTILLTQQCVEALAYPPSGLDDRGSHALKGKSAPVQVFSIDHREVQSQIPIPGPRRPSGPRNQPGHRRLRLDRGKRQRLPQPGGVLIPGFDEKLRLALWYSRPG